MKGIEPSYGAASERFCLASRISVKSLYLAALSSGRSNSNGHTDEHWSPSRQIEAHGRPGDWRHKPSPPTAMGPGCRLLTVQSRGFFASRHSKLAQFQSLDYERVATLPFRHPITRPQATVVSTPETYSASPTM